MLDANSVVTLLSHSVLQAPFYVWLPLSTNYLETFSGKFVPALAHEILQNKQTAKMKFQGIIIGSGLCDPPSMMNYGEFLLSLGIISEFQAKQFKRQERIILEHLKEGEYLKAFNVFNELIDGDRANKTRSYFKRKTGFQFKFNALQAKVRLVLNFTSKR